MRAHREWYTLSVSVQVPAWTDITPEVVLPAGRPIGTVGSKAHLPIARSMEEDLMRPSVEGYPGGSGFVRDDGELATRISQARRMWHTFQLSRHDWAEAEADQARKITLQRGGSPAWWVQADGLVVSPRPSMRPAFSAIAQTIMEGAPPDPTPVRYKQGTSHGWPDYATSRLSYALHALWARAGDEDWERFLAVGLSVADTMEQGDTPFSAILYNRTGPLGKEVSAYDTSGAQCLRVATLLGLCCRRRAVYGMPSAGNMLQKRWADLLKARMYRLRQFYHPGGARHIAAKISVITRALGPGHVWFSDDITAFDTNVRPNHQDEMADLIHGRISPRWRAFKHEWKDIPLLAAPIAEGAEAFLYDKHGGTPSGAIDTAIDGTLINAARIVMCLSAATGQGPSSVWAGCGKWWDFMCQGDDTLLCVPTSIDMAKYSSESLQLGYPAKLSTAMVFLMHHFTPHGEWAPLASRVFQQTVFNEYGGGAPSLELFSFIARATPQFWVGNPWSSDVGHALARAEPFTRYGVRPETAAGALSDPVFQHDLATVLATPLGRRRLAHLEEQDLPTRLSNYASALLTPVSDGDIAVPLTPAQAHGDALRIAAYMAVPADDRPPSITGLSSFTSELLESLNNRRST